MPITNRAATEKWFKSLENYPARVLATKMKRAVLFTHKRVLDRTPVHTGKALRNWTWSIDNPYSGVKAAVGTGNPGQTSRMPLGAEPRRMPNMVDPAASLATLTYRDPFHNYILANNDPMIIPLEYGMLPSPQRSRNPAGMVRITVQELLAALDSGKV